MNCQTIYDSLILRAITEKNHREHIKDTSDSLIYETHHILPRSLGGNDNKDNLVLLTLREHFIAHWLLYRIYKEKAKSKSPNDIKAYHKMATAFIYMCCGDVRGKVNSHKYMYAKIAYSNFLKEHHWAKSPEWKLKQSQTMREYYKNNPVRTSVVLEERTCMCGCGEKFTINSKYEKRFIHGHNSYVFDENKGKKISKTHKQKLSKLSKEQLSIRSKNSFGKCDHVLRGKKISESKKGKYTGQYEKFGAELYFMSDEEFQTYLNGKYSGVITRFTNARNKIRKIMETIDETQKADIINSTDRVEKLRSFLIERGGIN